MVSKLHEVVVSGIGGRFPDAYTVEEFKDKLFSKSNLLIRDLDRWNPAEEETPFHSGKIADWNKFDGSFFGMHPKLVRNSDPILGLLLEKSYEAMVDAGISPFMQKKKNICVISATALSDAELIRTNDGAFLEGLGMVGHSRTMMANRISYCFNLSGPSYNYDSSWTSSMEALDKATTLVAQGAVDGALVITCGLLAHYSVDEEYRCMNLLALDGKCLPFDAEANGFARSESVVAFFIQRAQEAKRNYCTIVHADSLYIGDKSRGYLQFSPMIETFLKDFYKTCQVNPSDIGYLETGSVCIKGSDAVELNAVANSFCIEDRADPLLIGSVTGNMGNAESPSGLVSLTKVIIALETGVIPPTINYNTPNPDVPALVSGKLKPVTEKCDLSDDLVAASSFNICGSLSHVLVKRNNKTKQTLSAGELPADGLPRLILLQARHEEGARAVVDKVQSMPVDVEFISLANDAFQTPVTAYLWRGYAVLPSAPNSGVQNIQAFVPIKRPVWFIFSGMGSQWAGMGRELLGLPVFAAAIDKCDRVLRPRGIDIKHIITSDDGKVFDNILNCFVGIAAVQIGIVDIMRVLGVSPDGMIGHSVGELGCAYADGCLTAEEMVLAAYFRGKASLEANYDDIGGMMAAVGMGYNDIKDRLPESLDVACHNAADSCTLSGPEEDVLQYVGQLKKQGVFAKAVSAGGIAYHSRYIKSVAPKLQQYLTETIPDPMPRSDRWVSSSVAEANWDSEDARLCSAEYHTNNLLSPVLFEEACRHLPKNAILVEIAPHGLLQAILKRAVCSESTNIALTSRAAPSNLTHLLNAVGKLYLNNVSVDVNALFPAVQYPVSRGTPSLVNLVTWNHEDVCYKEYSARMRKILYRDSLEKTVDMSVNHPDYRTWKDHLVDGQVNVPLTHLIMLPWRMVLARQRLNFDEECIVMEDVTVSDRVTVDDTVLVTIGPASQTFEVSKSLGDGLAAANVVTGKLFLTTPTTFTLPETKADPATTTEVTGKEVYYVLAQFGCLFGPRLQSIKYMLVRESGFTARVEWSGDVMTFLDQLFMLMVFFETDRKQKLCLPLHFIKLTVNVPAFKEICKGSEVEVFYDRACNTLMCEGVQLCGPILCPAARHTPLNLAWTETKYQPYYQTKQSLKEFWSALLNLVSNAVFGSWSDNLDPPQILIVKPDKEESNGISAILKGALNGNFIQSMKLKEVNITEAKKLIEGPITHGYIAAGNASVLKTIMNWAFVPDNVFFFTYETNPKSSNLNELERLKPILSYQSMERNLHLLKKVTNLTKANLVELHESNWLLNLRQLMSRSNDRGTTIVVIHNLKPKEVLPIIAKEPYVQNIRTVFLLDNNTPPFKLSNPFYYDQLSLGLFVNILYRGLWNDLSNISLNIDPKSKTLESSLKSFDNDVEVRLIGLNSTTFNPYQVEKGGEATMEYVDYVGFSKGKRVMGMAQFDPSSNLVTPDPTLRWTVPEDWTMDDAATVPVTYAMAYYCMSFEADIKKVRSILIHAGMSPIGQALVRIALGLDRDVFVSVLNNKEVEAIVKLFPLLNPKNILVLERDNIEISIKTKTSGKGVDLVFNCLQGKHLQSTLGVMGFYCQLIDLAGVNIKARESLGMSVFLKSTSFNAVSLNKLARCSDNWKQSITKMLNKGINDGVVMPLNRKLFRCNELTAALRNLMDKNSTEKALIVVDSERGSICKNTENLTIIAGTKADLWLDVAEWLVRRGSRRLLILTDEPQLSRNQKRRFNKLTKHYKVDAVITSAGRLDTYNCAKELLEDIQPMGTIASIICIGMDENSMRMKNLDAASREVVPAVRQFVSLLGEGAAVSESRARSGLAVCHVRSSSALQQPALVLPYLAALLDHTDPTARFLTVSDRDTRSSSTTSVDVHTCLPNSVEELIKLSEDISDIPSFTEAVTLSPGHSHVQHNLLPVFVIPGLGSARMNHFLQNLIHPAFCSRLPSKIDSIDKFAEGLSYEVLRIQSQGPFNIVGDTWGGAAALALGCLLEARGHQVDLILIEGAPSTLRSRVHALCDQYTADLGTSLLGNVLNLSPEVLKEITRLEMWEEKLSVCLAAVAESDRVSVGKALTSLYSQMKAVQLSEPSAQLFKGRVTLITCKHPSTADLNKLTQVCQQNPLIEPVDDEDYPSLLTDSKIMDITNDNMAFKWIL